MFIKVTGNKAKIIREFEISGGLYFSKKEFFFFERIFLEDP